MGKAEENKKMKRSALLSHAFSLFMSNGIANTSISDITNHAGVAKGTFYFYFRDKDDLVQKLIYQKGEQLMLNSLDELKKQGDMSVEDSIIFVSDDLIKQLAKDKKLLKFINKNLSVGMYQKAFRDEKLQDIILHEGKYSLHNSSQTDNKVTNNSVISASDSLHNTHYDFLNYFYELIEKDGAQWNHPLLMLYTIVELIGSTCHTILLEEKPVDYETYKPYLFQCIRNIIGVFRVPE